ncbi:hypothetical protein A9Q84_03085 [Halobacteriovorax marinus]|uniref:HTTM-like domain-containing protein n=1 Tax=Halobacteriovorax marinus TaxID=97084 RepID=A0A1Y5FD11_9BACT|nr:hypothetical protein A9Q84_03085 [Halobacteriovorax marinus]
MNKQFRYLAIARALIAFSTFLVLILNNEVTLFGMENGLNHFSSKYEAWNIFFLLGVEEIFLMKLVAIGVLVLSFIGILPRFTILLQLWVHWSFINGSITIEGGDQVAYLVILFLTPLFLIDNRMHMWKKFDGKISKFKLELIRFCINLVKIQAAIIYFVASVGKYPVEQWLNGTSIYYWFVDPTFGLPDFLMTIFNPLMKSGWFMFFMGWSVLILELSLATGFIIKNKYKKYLFIGGIGMHFSIFLFHGLPNFMLSMIGILIIYLLIDTNKLEEVI